MAKTANLYARIEPEIKKEAEDILEALGIPISGAINMFYKQIILHKGMPFDVRLPQPKQENSAAYTTAVSPVMYCSDTPATYHAGSAASTSAQDAASLADLQSYRLTSAEEPSDEMLQALMLKVRDSARESTRNAANKLKQMQRDAQKEYAKKKKKLGL